MSRDQLATRLLATFVGELEEQVRTMNADLLALEATPTDAERLKSLFRVAHTLKGAARAAGVHLVEQVCHALETRLAEARDGTLTLGREELARLFSAADGLADAGQRLKAGRDLEDSPLADLHQALTGAGRRPARSALAQPAASPPTPAAPSPAEPGNGQVRVDAGKLDALAASTGQMLVAGARVAGRSAELEALHDFASGWAAQWRRTGRRLRLELERSGTLPRAIPALLALEENLRRLTRETDRLTAGAAEDARALSQATAELAGRVRRLRMRPFAEACEVLPRAVRDVAAAAAKEAHLEIQGGDVEADRAVLDGLREAVLQLVRNAVDHGIEPPNTRQQAGKPRQGTVTVAAALRGDRLVVTVADDGAGLRVAAIRERLGRRGLPVPGDERELGRALLEGGLSTRAEATAISGRGVGLDIVRAAIERIRGTAAVTWIEGAGTTFTLECPPTLVTLHALLVAVGPNHLAVPTAHVERLLRVGPDEIKRAEGREVVVTTEGPVPLVALARLLGPPLLERPMAGAVPVVMLRAGMRRLAVVVDELLSAQELVLRPIGRAAQPLPHVSGAALLGTGRVALVLNAPAVVAAGWSLSAGPGLTVAATKPAGPVKSRILVVEDSITTRTLEQSVLEAAGYDVLTAVDGVDAWKVLQERGADLVVADVEMPRMDGLALCEAMRASKRFKEVPVVLVTALETPEQRGRGLEAGADAYLGKSSFDQQNLLDTIGQLLG